MNRYVKIIGIAAVVGVVALVGAAIALAQPPSPTQIPGGFGPGMMGGYAGGGGYGRGMMGGGFGFMAQYQSLVHAEIAEALGMSLDEFNAALAAGKTPYILAQEKGVDFAKVQTAMQTGMAEALKQAVKDGKITQAQADWMLARHAQMQAWHASGAQPGGVGPRGGFGPGMMGGQFGPGGFNGACPHLNNTPNTVPAPTD